MKKLLILLGLVATVGLASYFFCYHRAMASVVLTSDGTDAELAWLKREFALTPAQYEKVLALHRAYGPVCAGHCAAYMTAHQRLESLLKEQNSWSPAQGAALDDMARIRSECRQSMLHYAYDVAACMSPADGRRYLDMIRAQILASDPANMMASPP